jgi:hypothetical protein
MLTILAMLAAVQAGMGAGSTVLHEGTISVPHSHWRAVDVLVSQPGTVVKCSFEVPEGASKIQATLVTLSDAERFSMGRSFSPLASTGFDDEATLRYEAEAPGRYVLLLDNRIEGRRPTEVRLKIELIKPEFKPARTVPPEKRLEVVFASVLFVLGVVAFSARKMMR